MSSSSSRIRARSSSSHNSQSLPNISSNNANVVFSRLAFVVPILRFFGPDDALQVIQLRSLNTCFQEAVEEGHIDDVVWQPIVRAGSIELNSVKKHVAAAFFLNLLHSFSKHDPSCWVLQFLVDRGFDVDEQRFFHDGMLDPFSLVDTIFHFGSAGNVRWLLGIYPGGGDALKVQHELPDDEFSEEPFYLSSLLFSALHGNWDIVDVLVEGGVRDEIKFLEGSDCDRFFDDIAGKFYTVYYGPESQTALQEAVRRATPAVVQGLLAGPSTKVIHHAVEASFAEWEIHEAVTPLSAAVARVVQSGNGGGKRQDAMKIVQMLLDAGAKPRATTVNSYYWQTGYLQPSPLHAAIQHEDEELYRLLLAHGAGLNAKGRVLHYSTCCDCRGTCCFSAVTVMPPLAVPLYFCPEHDPNATIPDSISNSKMQWINRLIDDGARWPKFVDEQVPSPQLCAAATGNIGLLRRLVREAGCDINHEFAPWGDDQSEFSQAVTPLSIAIRRGRFHMVKALVEEFGCELKYPSSPFFARKWKEIPERFCRSLGDVVARKQPHKKERVRVAADTAENQQQQSFRETAKEVEDPGVCDDSEEAFAWLCELHVPEMVKVDFRSALHSKQDAMFLIKSYVFAPADSRLEIWSYLRGKLLAVRAE